MHHTNTRRSGVYITRNYDYKGSFVLTFILIKLILILILILILTLTLTLILILILT